MSTSDQITTARPSRRDLRLRAAEVMLRDGRITYPESLPISTRRDELLETIRSNAVVIVAGETGSGKSTQLPKLCLEAGRGVEGMIGHTQPRRVAARSIAERVAEELGTTLGADVGFTVRFNDRVGEGTLVKVMTDGVLLAEIQRDRDLRRYDTLIIDEAHERSLNIDFLIGYLKQLLPRRPDLKLIVTSATIDTSRFSAHFAEAPIIEVTGRTFPVEVRYRSFGNGPGDNDVDDDRDQVQAICDAVEELCAEGPGDVLVFLSGEREIHDTADALRRLELPHVEMLPLYARLSSAEQHRIFEPHTGRRIVLATNVAETSLTVPGVRSVVDAGTARISRYSHRLKVQRLPIEPISQASANQRAGRCGRLGPGTCIRLYDESDLAERPEFTEPEILRTNLASVILQMTALGLGDVAAFPFLDPPDARAIRDGVSLLEELGALPPDQAPDRRKLTPIGRRLAKLPIDPRLARMVVEAERLGCVREVTIIAAALSIQDPRERPIDKQQVADEFHRRFAVPGSDFLSLVKLWDHLREQQRTSSSSQFRRLCRSEYLNYLRVREWQDLVRQLRDATAELGIRGGAEAGHPDRVHQSLLAGLLSHLGMRDGESREFRGARGSKFMIGTGSVVAKNPPKWVMAAELVETNRLWGRVAASVQPEWAERIGGHLISRSYGEPRWDERSGRAVTSERVMLYGLPIVASRTVGYDRVDPEQAREMFIRHALVAGKWMTHHRFLAENEAVIDEVRGLADRMRRWNLVDDDTLFDFYDDRVGDGVVSGRHFDQWWKQTQPAQPRLLELTVDALIGGAGAAGGDSAFPDIWHQDGLELPVTYRFEPGEVGDGVAVHVPITALNQLHSDGFEWQVPGFRDELVAALVKTLPKELRRNLAPLAETSRVAAAQMQWTAGPMMPQLAAVLGEIGGDTIPASAFDVKLVADHLRITFSIENDDGRAIAIGKDLDSLRALVATQLRAAIADAGPSIERGGVVEWDFGDLPRVIETERAGHLVRGYPALLDDGDSVSIRVFTKPAIQERIMPGGVRRLLLLAVPVARKPLERLLGNTERLAIARIGSTSIDRLIDDCVAAAADVMITDGGGAPWTAAEFETLRSSARRSLDTRTADTLRQSVAIMVAASGVHDRMARLVTETVRASVDDARQHLDRLIHPGFVTSAGVDRLDDVRRYVRGIDRRLEKLPEDPGRDRRWMAEVAVVERRYRSLLAELAPSEITNEIAGIRWQIEELRMSLFAQSVGAKGSVSAKRIMKLIEGFEHSG